MPATKQRPEKTGPATGATLPTLRHAAAVQELEARITGARERVQELETAERQAFRELQTAKALDGSTTTQSDITLSKLRRAEFAHAEARSAAELAGEALQELASDLDALHATRPDPTAADAKAAGRIVHALEQERAPVARRLEEMQTAAADADTLRQAAEAIAAQHTLGTASAAELQNARAAAQAATEAGEATAGLARMLAEIDTRLQAARDARDQLQSEVDVLEGLRVSRELER